MWKQNVLGPLLLAKGTHTERSLFLLPGEKEFGAYERRRTEKESNLVAKWTKAHGFLQRGSGVRSPVWPKFQKVAANSLREVNHVKVGWRNHQAVHSAKKDHSGKHRLKSQLFNQWRKEEPGKHRVKKSCCSISKRDDKEFLRWFYRGPFAMIVSCYSDDVNE